ncbi:MAG: hypothetical protein ACK566_10075 [Bacteroidota bacterium]|jgi:hypothetical protein
MAYNRNKIYQQALDLIEKKKLFFIEDVVTLLPISKPTFYEFFEVDSNELNTIKELLDKNKIEVKNGLRNKWYNGNNPLTQMALYKLIGTEEEYHRIASTKTENKNINIEKPIFGGIDLDVEENDSTK